MKKLKTVVYRTPDTARKTCSRAQTRYRIFTNVMSLQYAPASSRSSSVPGGNAFLLRETTYEPAGCVLLSIEATCLPESEYTFSLTAAFDGML
jgi:hypothetical protein